MYNDKTSITNEELSSLTWRKRKQEEMKSTDVIDIDLRDATLSDMLIQRPAGYLMAMTWMDKYFSSVGDHMPNSNEIHLKIEKQEIHRLMSSELESYCWDEGVVAGESFLKIWKTHSASSRFANTKRLLGNAKTVQS